ncbi:MAG: 1-deoxy-D-xylulose-5-phosphate reductoisomerase [Pseudomonadota bacterium]|nr:1-deoxy-D-xylulose-5-phosphate reductoisomerase [Pseudomonadota bacterium]
MKQQGICILGSTGTIGINTLDVIRRHPQRFKVIALTGNRQITRMLQQCEEWQPKFVVMSDEGAAAELRQRLGQNGSPIKVLDGNSGLADVVQLDEVDTVMAGIVGAVGLLPTLAAVKAGKRVLIANKEPLVMLGQLFIDEAKLSGAVLLPIDSEHNAIFQCLPAAVQQATAVPVEHELPDYGIRQILLTGSGGPFLNLDRADFHTITPEQACSHPNWVMGRKISVDSATMMNKGLELIEACALFSTSPEQIKIVVHPQSVIHSMVEYADGSLLAQLGNPDMRTPIAHALAWPERIDAGVERLDLLKISALEFQAPDMLKFPALSLARTAAETGGTLPAILNAGNEVAVQAFLEEKIRFDQIVQLVEETMEAVGHKPEQALEDVLAADQLARDFAVDRLSAFSQRVHGN